MKKTFPVKVSKPIEIDFLVESIGNCQLIKPDSNQKYIIKSVSAPHNADKNSLVFCKLKDIQGIEKVLNNTNAQVIVVSRKIKTMSNQILVITNDPLEWFIKALNLMFESQSNEGINKFSIISSKSLISNSSTIGANTVIEKDCIIGKNCNIGSNCYIGKGTIIGDGVFIQNNVSIGSVGLGYHVTKHGERLFLIHLGSVIIEDNVVIGSGCVIVRGQLQDTIIHKGSRLGNLVNIGHNVLIGKNCSISSNTCVAGGVTIAEDCNIAAGVTISPKLTIGKSCQIGLGSVVINNVPPNISIFGNPAKPLPTMRRF
jgi:UDP-3-O-[3-hydroxymyristoyl] glucosamine N-acyltransferase